MLHGPILVAVPASALLWAVSLSIGGVGGSGSVGISGTERIPSQLEGRMAESAVGAAAERLIARALLQGFDDGLELVAVAEELRRGASTGRSAAEPRVVALDLDGFERRSLRVGLDGAGRVSSAQVWVGPGRAPRRTYRRTRELAITLGAGRVVHSLAMEPLRDGGARLVGTVRGGRRFAVDLGDFERLEPPEACETSCVRM